MKMFMGTFKFIVLLCFPMMIACGRPVLPAADPSPVTASTDMLQLRAEVLKLLNEYRRQHGLGKLQPLELVEELADDHSAAMASGRIAFGHDGFEKRYKELNSRVKGVRAMAENVAFGKLSATKVVDLWLHSAGHRKNIEGNYNFTGIGIVAAKNGQLYFTQIFLLKE